MIDIRHKADCCGCEACVQVCPKKCIDFSKDSQGFLYPQVNKESCIVCGLGEKVCPVINKTTPAHNAHATLYAVKSNDDAVRAQSSSGGYFSLIAEFVLDKEGVIFGAAFDGDFNVCHTRVDNIADLPKLRGSKYVQSRIGQTFKECKEDLNKGKLVLFTGTPCQISALKHFLRKDYDNLIKVEVVCHGVPSPMIYKQYIQESVIKDYENLKISKVNFRNKMEGSWRRYYFTVEYNYAGELHMYKESINDSLYMKGFLNDLYIRPSCFSCPAKNFTSGADFTIADFWGQEYTFPEFDDDKGVSAVFANTARAQDIFNDISAVVVEKPFADFIKYNPYLVKSPVQKPAYFKFWKSYDESKSLKSSIVKVLNKPLIYRVVNKFRSIIRNVKRRLN